MSGETQALADKLAVVTGGGSGIGLAIAREFVRSGAEVVVLERDPESAGDQLAEEIASGGCRIVQADVAESEEMEAAFGDLDRLDILVNNAGIAHVGNVIDTDPEDMDRLYAVNVKGVYHGLHFGVARMLHDGGGAILNMASIASHLGISDRFAYSMTKGAVLSMTLSVARDYVDRDIRCNCLCPARVHTPFVDGFIAANYPGREDEMFQELGKFQPLGRMGSPEEIASLARFLCSDEAAFITGSAYDIDGGVTRLR